MKYRKLCCCLKTSIFLFNAAVFAADPDIVNIDLNNATKDDFVKGLLPNESEENGPNRVIRTRSIKKVYATPKEELTPKEIGVNLAVTFAFNSTELSYKSKQVLDSLAEAMSSELAPYKFRIEGYTDGVGSAPYNMELSARRAQAVKSYLVSKNGIESVKLDTIGMGESNLFNPDDPAAAENRRVQIVNEGRLN